MTVQIPERVAERVRQLQRGHDDECWIWPKCIMNNGYGGIGWLANGRKEGTTAHRVSWSAFRGPIPDGLTVDHLCRVRSCWNPNHLRLLTMSENASDNGFATKTHCPQGHPYSGDNLYKGPSKRNDRRCRECARQRRVKARTENAV